MNMTSSFPTTLLVTGMLVLYACSASSQEVTQKADPNATTANGTTTSAPAANVVTPHFDFEYTDSGIDVYVTRIFSQYQLDADEVITADNSFVADVFQNNHLQSTFGSTSQTKDSKVPYVEYDVMFIGTAAEVADREIWEADQEKQRKERVKEAIKNRMVGILMHAANDIALHTPITPYNGPKQYVGESTEAAKTRAIRSEIFQVLKDGEQKNALSEGMGNQKIQVHPDDIIFIADIAVGHKAFRQSGERSVFYFVLPKSMSAEVPIGQMYSSNYGPTFSAVLSRVLLKAANIVLAPPGTVTKKTLAAQREKDAMSHIGIGY
jgi:hypothetical protein